MCFLPRDAMLARYMPWLCVRVRACLTVSVTSRNFIKTDEQIKLIFGTGASFNLSMHIHSLIRKFGYFQKWGYFSLELCPNCGLRNFSTASHSRTVVGFCGHPHYCYRPYYLTARSYMVSEEPFPDRQNVLHLGERVHGNLEWERHYLKVKFAVILCGYMRIVR